MNASPVSELSPFISVIVPVRNEASHIRQTVQDLLNQKYDGERFEVIVVDGESTDDTAKIVASLAKDRGSTLKLFSNPNRLSSAARNIGVSHARGDILVVIDGHCQVDDVNYLSNLAEAFAKSRADCLGRPQPLDVAGGTSFQRAIALARSSWLGHHPASFIYSQSEQFVPPQSVAVAYRRSVFDSVGLFDESFDACEDVEFNHRVDKANLRCYFTPKIAVRYHPRSSLKGLFRQMARYGRGRLRLLRKHPETLSLGSLMPALFVSGLLAGSVAAFFSTTLAALFGAFMLVYTLVVTSASIILAQKARLLRNFPLLLVTFPTIHLGSGTGFLSELITNLFARHKASPHVIRN
jgi:succinoglycan biosynthesis protein ExoA